jgi:zinc protease
MNRTLIVIPILSLASLIAQDSPRMQQPADFKGVVLKNKAPVSNEILKVKFPQPAESKLKNGQELMVLEDHRLPVIGVEIAMPASSLNDPESVPLSAATADLMQLGTKTKDSKKIVEMLAELGASVSFSVGERYAYAGINTLTENLDAVLDLTADILFNPVFPQEELDKWKNQQLSQLQQVRAQPEFLATERFAQAMYPDDRRSYVGPSADDVRSITRDMVVNHHKRIFRPENARVTVLGDTNARKITPKLEKLFVNWKGGSAPRPPNLPMLAATTSRKVILVNRPNSVQTVFYVGNHAIDRLSQDYVPVQVLNRILGAGPSSRLFRNIREEKGYTYGINSEFSASRHMNHFLMRTSVRTEITGEALAEILREFADLRNRLVPAAELTNAKRALVARFALRTEGPQAALSNATEIKEYGFPANYWDTYPAKIAAVTAEAVQRVARKYLLVDNLLIVAVGDASKIRDVLSKYGPVEEWDTEGHRIQ